MLIYCCGYLSSFLLQGSKFIQQFVKSSANVVGCCRIAGYGKKVGVKNGSSSRIRPLGKTNIYVQRKMFWRLQKVEMIRMVLLKKSLFPLTCFLDGSPGNRSVWSIHSRGLRSVYREC